MHDPYQVLGVRSGAADEEIKAAFRHLAKQLLPTCIPQMRALINGSRKSSGPTRP